MEVKIPVAEKKAQKSKSEIKKLKFFALKDTSKLDMCSWNS